MFYLIVGGVVTPSGDQAAVPTSVDDTQETEIGLRLLTASKASAAEVNTGTNDTKYVTPKAIRDSDVAALSDLAPITLKSKYMLALINKVHMELDLHTELSGLTPLASDADLATAGSHLTPLIDALNDHFGDYGASAFTDAPHLANDTTSGSGLGTDVSSLENQILRCAECAVAIVAHGDEVGVHFNDDTTSSGTGYTLPVIPPVTQANVNTCVNSLIAAVLTHNSRASF